MKDAEHLKERIERQARRMKQAQREQPTLLSQTVFTGTLGLVLVLPIVAGAYLGHWLDNQSQDYSVRWTLGMILLGTVIGAFNVYYLIRERS